MTPTLIVICLLGLGVGIVVWATRRKSAQPPVGPREADTAWNDPITPGAAPAPREGFAHEEAPTAPPSPQPRP